MIILINGSFGVGKTTIAKLLRNTFPGSAIYDPEWVGMILMRLPKWLKLKGSDTDDFQNIELWRSLTVFIIKLVHFVASGPLIVPMTFTERAYLDEVVVGFKTVDPEVKVFCLRANLESVRKRLRKRGTRLEGTEAEWIARRILECNEAHRNSHFGEPVNTENRPATEVAAEIINRLQKRDTVGLDAYA